eukprot:6178430-Pleurochrysis_carterae.AAC.1
MIKPNRTTLLYSTHRISAEHSSLQRARSDLSPSRLRAVSMTEHACSCVRVPLQCRRVCRLQRFAAVTVARVVALAACARPVSAAGACRQACAPARGGRSHRSSVQATARHPRAAPVVWAAAGQAACQN